MQTQLLNFLFICSVSFSLFFSPILASASRPPPARRHVPSPAAGRHDDSGGRVFPHLSDLRNWAAQLVFGPPTGGRGRGNGHGHVATAKGVKTNGGRGGHGGQSMPNPGAAALRNRYGDDVVVRFNVTGPEEEGALAAATDRLFLDVWAFTPDFVDVRLRRQDLPSLMKLVPASSPQPYVIIPDVAAAVWATYPDSSSSAERAGNGGGGSSKRRNKDFGGDRIDAATVHAGEGVDNVFFSRYQPLPVIVNWLRLVEAMYPEFAALHSIGKSFEGREIWALRVGKRMTEEEEEETGGGSPRKTILVMGGLHAREWISTSTVNYLLWSLTTAHGRDSMITKLIQHFDVVFVPVANPDGYDYTWRTDRLWRKSRQQTAMRVCRGLDLDRAFGFEWDAVRHRNDPCSDSYGGDRPFEAVEAEQLAAWAKNATASGAAQFVGLLDLHSYAQEILFPYSYTCKVDPPNRENLEELGAGLAKAIRLSSGEVYNVMSACEGAVARNHSAASSSSSSPHRIESGGGSAIDWFYHELGARFSYQIKLRDTGSYGFLLPPENIVPTGEEVFHAVKYFGDYLLGNNGIEKMGEKKKEEEDWSELKRRRRR